MELYKGNIRARSTCALEWTLRGRTVVTIAVPSRFFSFPLAVKIRRPRRTLRFSTISPSSPLFKRDTFQLKGEVSLYIQYTMDQLVLPIALEEDIPENHPVRVVNAAIHRLDDAIFDAAYPGVSAIANTENT